MYSCKKLAYSINPVGVKLATLEVTFPRYVLPQLLTHRSLSRNSASSRAIPTWKLILSAIDNPFIPETFTQNGKGMSPDNHLDEVDNEIAAESWLGSRDFAVYTATKMAEREKNNQTSAERNGWKKIYQFLIDRGYDIDFLPSLNIHKQHVNRVLEPYLWHTVILSATDWDNFIYLRDHPDAQEDISKLARLIHQTLITEVPTPVKSEDWHLPLILDDEKDLDIETKIKVSVGRAARISYLTHNGVRDIQEDIKLYNRLITEEPLHASPGEHVAMALDNSNYIGNYRGWLQHRKQLPNENKTGIL
jgi:thymidylate synthase ThyX